MAQNNEYPRGAIKRIEVMDFMSFAGRLVLEAGPRVNVVEGPNGCGKSSMVTALCVGLAGPMKALGRQTRPEEVIRGGCSAFEVEITLSGGAPHTPDIAVRRRTELVKLAAAARGSKRRHPGNGATGAQRGVNGNDEDDDGDEDDADYSAGGGGCGGGRGTDKGRSAAGVASGGGRGGGCVTHWHVDGRPATEARVKELARSLGINFENPCQFLPQERVSEFTSLSPTQLLESTEEAIGDGELLRQHKELRELGAELKMRRETSQRDREQLGRVEAEQAAHEPDYQRLQRRNALRQQVEQLRLKMLWVARERTATQVQQARARVAAAQGEVAAARQRLAEAEAPLNTRRNAIEAAQRTAAQHRSDANRAESKLALAMSDIAAQKDTCKALEDQIDLLKSESAKWSADVDKCKQDLQKVRSQRAQQPTGLSQQQLARLQQIGAELTQAAGEVGALDLERGQKAEELRQIDAEIQQLEAAAQRRRDFIGQRLAKLDAAQPGSRQLYEWIRETRHAGGFRRRVLGPLLMEIQPVANKDWAAFLEQALGPKNLAAVVVETREDNDLVHDWLQRKKNEAQRQGSRRAFLHKIFKKEGAHGQLNHPLGEAATYSQHGITHTLDQVFEASSDLVKLALADNSAIHVTYVGSSLTSRPQVMERLLRETPVRRVFTPKMLTIASISKYDRSHMYQNIEDVRKPHLLDDDSRAGYEAAEQQHLEQLRQARSEVSQVAAQLLALWSNAEAASKALSDEKQRIVESRRDLERTNANLVRQEAVLVRRLQRLHQKGDPLAGMEALRRNLRREGDVLFREADALYKHLRSLHATLLSLAPSELAVAAASASLTPLQRAVRQAREAVTAAEGVLAAARQAASQCEERARAAAARVREGLGGAEGPNEEMQAAWAEWPVELEALEAALDRKEVEAEQAQAALRSDEVRLLTDWQRRATEIGELKHRLEEGEAAVVSGEAELEAKKAAWLPALRRHMSAINTSLRGFFTRLRCEGEVVLREDPNGFDEYAAEIRVKYRPNEPLQLLNRNHHSGGERSVATMLYLMALQSLDRRLPHLPAMQGVTSTPFRVVDEINQGMDSRNERKVFNLLVECSSRPETPQCFLITPKLIANLHYNDHVRVQSVRFASQGGVAAPPGFFRRLAGGGEIAEQQQQGQHHHHQTHHQAGAAGAGGSSCRGPLNAPQQHRQQQVPGTPFGPGVVETRLGQVSFQLNKDVLLYGIEDMQEPCAVEET